MGSGHTFIFQICHRGTLVLAEGVGANQNYLLILPRRFLLPFLGRFTLASSWLTT